MKCTGVKRSPIICSRLAAGRSDVFLKCQKFWVSRLRLHEQIPQSALLSLLRLHELTNKISLKTPWQHGAVSWYRVHNRELPNFHNKSSHLSTSSRCKHLPKVSTNPCVLDLNPGPFCWCHISGQVPPQRRVNRQLYSRPLPHTRSL